MRIRKNGKTIFEINTAALIIIGIILYNVLAPVAKKVWSQFTSSVDPITDISEFSAENYGKEDK